MIPLRSYPLHLLVALLSGFSVFSQVDAVPDSSGKKVKIPKHYFATTFYLDMYSVGESKLITKDLTQEQKDLAEKLGKYKYSQNIGGFYFPFKTTEKVHADGRVSNWHWLGTANYMVARPRFTGISDHNLTKLSLGVRAIYNSGKKGIWFIDMAPFVSGDQGKEGTYATRWGTTVLYDRMVSPKFSFRVGYTRTFILGNRFHLPYLGVRFGRLDRTYFSMQFPRGMTFSTPIGSKMRLNIFTRPTGSLLTMANNDSLYNGLTNKNRLDSTIVFGRYDGLFGLRLEYKPNRHLSFFAELGKSNIRAVGLFSRQYNKPNGDPIKENVQVYKSFFTSPLRGAGFISLGLTVRIGKTRSVYNNYNMYEVFNTNTSVAPGDNNHDIGSGDIPNEVKLKKKKEQAAVQTLDVHDLIETQDLYN